MSSGKKATRPSKPAPSGAHVTGRPDGGSVVLGDSTLALEWVDVSKCVKKEGVAVFTPRCAHAVAVLPVTSKLARSGSSGMPCAFASIGGCSETEYFPLDDVRDSRGGLRRTARTLAALAENLFLGFP